MIVREMEKQERKYALDIIWSVFLHGCGRGV